MYTWGYIKEATLAKLDMTADEASEYGFLNKFPFYANEGLIQIASAIKADRKTCTYTIKDRNKVLFMLKHKYKIDYDLIVNKTIRPENMLEDYKKMFDEYNSYLYIGDKISMPKDFMQWIDEPVQKAYERGYTTVWKQARADEYFIAGHHQIVFNEEGTYLVPYDGLYMQFTSTTDDDEILEIPADIVNAIPSYIASQCFKIDDEQKSSIFRNEYEMFLARINDDDYATNKTFKTEGNW